MNPTDLKPHPLNEKIYGEEPVDPELAKSIEKIGLLEKLVIKNDGTVISGHRRLKAILKVGPEKIKKVPCEIVGFADEFEEKETLVSYNIHRKKTDVQLANEGIILEEIYKHKAEQRSLANLKQNSENKDRDSPDVLKLSTSDNKNQPGRTRAKVAKDLGIGEESYRRLKKLREASESDDTVIAQIAERLLKDSMSKNKKYNLFLNFMKIYHDCNSENSNISDYATGLVSDIYARFTKIEDAHLELSNYIKAVENKEKVLKDEYPSDDYESESKECIEDEAGFQEEKSKNVSSILSAKPADKSEKPKVSPKYQALLDKSNDENVFVADFARHQLKCVDNGELTTDDAFENVKGFIREEKQKEKARREMLKTPEESGEILEKESERPNSDSSQLERPKDQNNVDTHGVETPSTPEEKEDNFCERCKEGPIVGSGGVSADIKILISASMEAAKHKQNWSMDNHLLLNRVLVELTGS